MSGGRCVLVCLLTGMIFIGYFVATSRWHRTHRLRTGGL
jgi:hypothetical protein